MTKPTKPLQLGQCPACLFRFGHDEGCEWQSPSTLTSHELTVWLSALGATGSTASADARVRVLRAHLVNDVPSLFKDPTLEVPQ